MSINLISEDFNEVSAKSQCFHTKHISKTPNTLHLFPCNISHHVLEKQMLPVDIAQTASTFPLKCITCNTQVL